MSANYKRIDDCKPNVTSYFIALRTPECNHRDPRDCRATCGRVAACGAICAALAELLVVSCLSEAGCVFRESDLKYYRRCALICISASARKNADLDATGFITNPTRACGMQMVLFGARRRNILTCRFEWRKVVFVCNWGRFSADFEMAAFWKTKQTVLFTIPSESDYIGYKTKWKQHKKTKGV